MPPAHCFFSGVSPADEAPSSRPLQLSRCASMSDVDTPPVRRGVLRHIYTSQGVIEYESVSQEEGDEAVEEEKEEEEEEEEEEESSVGPVDVNTKAPPVGGGGGGTLHHIYFRSGDVIPIMSDGPSPAIPPEEMAEELAALRAMPPLPPGGLPARVPGAGRPRRNSSAGNPPPSFSAPPRQLPRRASFACLGQRFMPTITEEEDHDNNNISAPLPRFVFPPRRRQPTLAPIGTPSASSTFNSPNNPPSNTPAPLQPFRRARKMATIGSGSAQLLPGSEAVLDDAVPLPPGHPHANDRPMLAQHERIVAPPVNYAMHRQYQQLGQQGNANDNMGAHSMNGMANFGTNMGTHSMEHQKQGQQGNVSMGAHLINGMAYVNATLPPRTTNGTGIGMANPSSNLSGHSTTNMSNTPIAITPRAHAVSNNLTTPNNNGNGNTFISIPPRAHTVAPSTRGGATWDRDVPLPPSMVGDPPLLTPMMPHYWQHEQVAVAQRRIERDAKRKQEGILVDVEDGELW